MEITKEIICPNCGASQKYNIHTGISGVRTPKLKQMILSETLFEWRCKKCNYFADMAYPFVYSDPDAALVVCLDLVPGTNVVKPVPGVEGMDKRMVKNPAEMKEKIMISDAGYSDVAMELVKCALCDIIRTSYKVKRVHAYFCRENEGELEFAVFLPGKNEPVYHSTKVDVYTQSEAVLKAIDYSQPDEFIRVDSALARKILQDYKNLKLQSVTADKSEPAQEG